MFLSIITPTYNRAHTLKRCYLSLCEQTDKDFEWIVVDDGSSDNTKELIAGFIAENIITIKYYLQENGGKQRAHNRGVSESSGKLCVCVDSDDALSSDAVSVAKKTWNNNSQKNIIGILAKRGDFDKHEPICSDLPSDIYSSTMLELQQKYNFSGDTVLFFNTDLMKKNLFCVFEGEKFLPEDSLYVVLDDYGEMILLNKVLYYCEYLPDGLTKKYHKLLADNPIGTSYSYYLRAIRSKTICQRIHNMIISKSYYKYGKKRIKYSMEKMRFIQFVSSIVAPLYIKIKIGKNI